MRSFQALRSAVTSSVWWATLKVGEFSQTHAGPPVRGRFRRSGIRASALTAESVRPPALDSLLRHAVATLGLQAAAILVAEDVDGVVRIVAAEGAAASDEDAQSELARRVLLEDAVHVDDAGNAAAAPISGAEGTIGALWVQAPAERTPPGEDDLRLLTTLADIATALLEPAPPSSLAATVRAGSVEAMAALLSLRDGFAAADAEEMVRLACDVGRGLGMPDEQLTELMISARLHDIGKIAVPDRILHKPGPLDEDERLVMQRHPVWGAETLARAPGLGRVAEIVRSHHERWDGAGYPSGVAGEDIPLASRIIGACESFRAMTSERPYRRSVERGEALALISAAAGSHFDPAVARALRSALAKQGVTPIALDRPGKPATRHGERAPAAGYGGKLSDALARLDALPALAESRDRLLALLDEERPSVAAIVATVESDLALVIAVLRMANQRSTGRGRIATIPDAVAALTPEGVEMLALRIAVVDFFEQAPGWGAPPEQVRLHAVAVKRAADRIAREAGWKKHDELLVAALLHDVGKLVLSHSAKGYPESVHGTARTPEQRVRAERHVLGLDHSDVGGLLLRRWRLPESIAEAVEHHHDQDPQQPAAAVIRLADMLAHHLHGNAIDHERLVPAAQAAGISAQTLRSLMYELPAGSSGDDRRAVEPCPLSRKELEVMRLLARGMVYKEISAEMGLSASTVRSHLHNAYRRLGVADRAQAVIMCTERGWL